ncbi:hypothetical protein Pcinc_019871 [Petrolisthes cinctipes]|uniref:Bcl-2 Bcl-2 homology region 1-3 domain-containing protein n=1 Tax=Petrolisthes cinctipes TaxID=88211 RepID=A0AAE1KKL0_PETCI|nr:hypothetical protein Pcinc_019871 [Petrolisthes cinctipes]
MATGGHTTKTTDGVATGGYTTTSTTTPSPFTHTVENGVMCNAEAKTDVIKEEKTKESDIEDKKTRESAIGKSKTLATFIVSTLTSPNSSGDTKDPTEATLLRCVRLMMSRHEILLKGMMKRLGVTRETGYVTFVGMANQLFEIDAEGKVMVTWGRIIALYAFGARLAMYCQEKEIKDFCGTIAFFLGTYAAEVVTPFVIKSGGWTRLNEEFPAGDDLENKALKFLTWTFLTWTAIGLGLAATASFFTSH